MPMTDANIAHEDTLAERALPIGAVLSDGQFTITGHLGAGGFGMTYRAKDNVLGRTIVIKECFHEDFCFRDGKSVVARSNTYVKPVRSIVKMFMREARSLAKLRHPNIVGVHRAFEENETAYMALDLIDGQDLFDILEANTTFLSPARVRDILLQLLDAVEKVHELDLLHRDISPDNIVIEKSGTPVLIDFGAARGDASRHTRAVSSLLVVKDGYSPQEFYMAGSKQTPSSDLYALAATFYHVLSGEAPANSQTRMIEVVGNKPDPCTPLAGRIDGYDQEFLQAIDRAMQIHPTDRLQSAAEWRNLISDTVTDTGSSPEASARVTSKDIGVELELSLTRLVEETNDEVRKTKEITPEPEEVAAPPEEPSKPDWIEEFNRESLAPATEPESADGEGAGTHLGAADRQSIDPMRIGSKPTRTETNWIERALEKQERLRNQRERELQIYEAEAIGRVRSASTKNSMEGPIGRFVRRIALYRNV